MEILCRASAFLVRSENPKFTRQFHIVTASHVVAPWRFPKYYPDDWLRYVNENHTKYTVEVRDEDGFLTTESELLSASYHHSSRDLAVLHLDEEDEALEIFEYENIESLELLARELIEGEELQFHGHDVAIPSAITADTNGDNGDNSAHNTDNSIEDNRHPKPLLIHGTFFSKTPHQFFARTSPVLTYGMCGGPVTAKSSSTTTSASGVSKTSMTSSVCGMLEGIVPVDSVNENIRGLAAFVDTTTLNE